MSGRLSAERLVLDASAFARQNDLIEALRGAGRELSLDTNVAELSSIGRFQGAAKTAPWAQPDGILTPLHILGNQNPVLAQIARFAVSNKLDRLHAPTHFLADGVRDPWFKVDLEACERLRYLLDIEGGKEIAIDYPLILTNAALNDAAERAALLSGLAGLPIQSVWLRTSGFGADATPIGIRKYIVALKDFQTLRIPVVSDGVGGMASLAIAAFGAASGLAHGVAEKERFDAAKWNKPPTEGRSGGGGYSVLLSGIDRLLKKDEAELLMGAPHARRLFSCQNRACCPGGFEDTLKDAKGHYLRQRQIHCEALSIVPDQLKPQHFLEKTLTPAHRTARQASKLKINNERLGVALVKNALRLERMGDVLEDLKRIDEDATRAPAFQDISQTKGKKRNQGKEN